MDRSLLSRSQHAYIKGKSVENALHDVAGFIEANLAWVEYTLSAFLDIEGSFSNLNAFLIVTTF